MLDAGAAILDVTGRAAATGRRGRRARTCGRRPRPRPLGDGAGHGRRHGWGLRTGGLASTAASRLSVLGALGRARQLATTTDPATSLPRRRAWSSCALARRTVPRSGAGATAAPTGSCRSRRTPTPMHFRWRYGTTVSTSSPTPAPTATTVSRSGGTGSGSTAAHNTVEVGGVSQSESGGPFLWTTQARTRTSDL